MNDLDQRLDAAASALLAACTTLPAPAEPTRAPRSRVLASAVAVAMAAGAVAVTGAAMRRDDRTTGQVPATKVDVVHERGRTTLAFNLQCSDPIEPAFTTAEYEFWADRAGRRWRTTLTFPDGTTFDVVRSGSFFYPDMEWSRGRRRDDVVAGCGFDTGESITVGVLGGIEVLNTTPEEGEGEQALVAGGVEEQGGSLVGPASDSLGRPATLWRVDQEGEALLDGSATSIATAQVLEWYLDDQEQVIERRMSNRYESLGEAAATTTLLERSSITVPETTFDTTGWASTPGSPRPHRDCPSAAPVSSGPLTAYVTEEPECVIVGAISTLTVVNDGDTPCHGQAATEVSKGLNFVFRPSNESNGSTVAWSLFHPDPPRAGSVDYPPGTTSWLASFDGIGTGQFTITLPPIVCGTERIELRLELTIP